MNKFIRLIYCQVKHITSSIQSEQTTEFSFREKIFIYFEKEIFKVKFLSISEKRKNHQNGQTITVSLHLHVKLSIFSWKWNEINLPAKTCRLQIVSEFFFTGEIFSFHPELVFSFFPYLPMDIIWKIVAALQNSKVIRFDFKLLIIADHLTALNRHQSCHGQPVK